MVCKRLISDQEVNILSSSADRSSASLTLNEPIATKVVCLSRLLKCLRASMANSVDRDQTAPIGAVCSGSMLFASILNLSVMLGNFLQQTTSADDILRCIFLGALRVYSLLGLYVIYLI